MRSGDLERTINGYKYDNRKYWALIFGRVLAGFLEEEAGLFQQFDLIVASPTFISRSGEGRDWDHTRLVLEKAHVESRGEWPFDIGDGPPAIIKTAVTPSMMGKTWKQRFEIAKGPLRNSLEIPSPARTEGKTILVYDDVFTDGQTLNEVARCLRRVGGAELVCGVTLARQQWGKKRPTTHA